MLSDELKMPTFTTERLLIRALSFEDAPAIHLLRSNELVNLHLDRPKTTSIEEAKEFIDNIHKGTMRKDCYYWAICFKDNDKLLGTTCLWNISEDNKKAEMGYELHPDYQGQGIMHEAIGSVINFAFNTLHFSIITAVTKPENVSSIKLLDKHGFLLDIDFTYDAKEEMKHWVGYYLKNKLL